MNLKKGDIIVILLMFLIVLVISVGAIIYQSNIQSLEVVITQDSEILYRYTLSNSLDEVLRIDYDGHYNEVHIHNGQVWIEEADCYNQVCVQKGTIDKAGETIVCIPHKLVIEIKGRREAIDVMVE